MFCYEAPELLTPTKTLVLITKDSTEITKLKFRCTSVFLLVHFFCCSSIIMFTNRFKRNLYYLICNYWTSHHEIFIVTHFKWWTLHWECHFYLNFFFYHVFICWFSFYWLIQLSNWAITLTQIVVKIDLFVFHSLQFKKFHPFLCYFTVVKSADLRHQFCSNLINLASVYLMKKGFLNILFNPFSEMTFLLSNWFKTRT